jgi:hypothetical protein
MSECNVPGLEHVEIELVSVESDWMPVGLDGADRELGAFIEANLVAGHTLIPGTVAAETKGDHWRFRARIIPYGRAYGLGERWGNPIPATGPVTVHVKRQAYLH